jgi:hypothetical protein
MIIPWGKKKSDGCGLQVVAQCDIAKRHSEVATIDTNVIRLPRQSQGEVQIPITIYFIAMSQAISRRWLYVSWDWRLSTGCHSRAKVCSSPRTTASQSCAASCDSETCRVLPQLSTCSLDVVHTLFLKGKTPLTKKPNDALKLCYSWLVRKYIM